MSRLAKKMALKDDLETEVGAIFRDKWDRRDGTAVPIDKLLVARAGIRGANDLVWIGKAANHAAKLCAESDDYPTWISGDKLADNATYGCWLSVEIAKYSNRDARLPQHFYRRTLRVNPTSFLAVTTR